MNLLTVVQTFCARTGLPQPTFVATTSDAQIKQIHALVNEAVEDIWTRWSWQQLVREVTFTTIAAEDQGAFYDTICGVAADKVRYVLQKTIYNRTLRLPIYGPMAATEWQAIKALPSSGPINRYRVRGGKLLMDPVPTAGHSCAFEIQTGLCVSNAAGDTFNSVFAADTDIFLLDYKLLLAALRWKWKSEKGLDYAEDFTRYELLGQQLAQVDATKPVLHMSGGSMTASPAILVPAGTWNIP